MDMAPFGALTLRWRQRPFSGRESFCNGSADREGRRRHVGTMSARTSECKINRDLPNGDDWCRRTQTHARHWTGTWTHRRRSFVGWLLSVLLYEWRCIGLWLCDLLFMILEEMNNLCTNRWYVSGILLWRVLASLSDEIGWQLWIGTVNEDVRGLIDYYEFWQN